MGIYQDGLKGGSIKELMALARKRKVQLWEAEDDYARVINELERRNIDGTLSADEKKAYLALANEKRK